VVNLFFEPESPNGQHWRERLFIIVFRHDTVAGKTFDISLIAVIFLSVIVAMMDSVKDLHVRYGELFLVLEWGFTALFTVEYALRLAIVNRPLRYATSFYGLIDVLALLPTYLALFFSGIQFLIVLRILRILRIFKILHMNKYVEEGGILIGALIRSSRKIFIFLLTILTVITIFGALMYLIEGEENGFTSIPTAMYWAIVTVATVGFGDLAPVTPLGRFFTSILILIGYGIIAVPTGIYAAELFSAVRQGRDLRTCGGCGLIGHDADAKHCRACGHALETPSPSA
jgi:voltage-gated potassium channel